MIVLAATDWAPIIVAVGSSIASVIASLAVLLPVLAAMRRENDRQHRESSHKLTTLDNRVAQHITETAAHHSYNFMPPPHPGEKGDKGDKGDPGRSQDERLGDVKLQGA